MYRSTPRRFVPLIRRCFSSASNRIIYTKTDEAPMLATYALLPIIRRFTGYAGIAVELSDISVAARILAAFGQHPDKLSELGAMAKDGTANIIKLPNISASVPQLLACIDELQTKGFDVPDFPSNPQTNEVG